MPEQTSPLARSDRYTASTDTRSPRNASPARNGSKGPDPFVLGVSGILLFVVLMLVVVFRTLYPAGI